MIVSHDVNTMTEAANTRLIKGLSIFGLMIVPQKMPVGDAVSELEMIIFCSEEDDFENIIQYLPMNLL